MRFRRGTAAVSEKVTGQECHCELRLVGRRPGPFDSRARIRPLGYARRCFGLKHQGRSAAAHPRTVHPCLSARPIRPGPGKDHPRAPPARDPPSLHPHRALGGHRDHRRVDRAALAGGPGGPRGGPAHPVREQPQADRYCPPRLPRRLQHLPFWRLDRRPRPARHAEHEHRLVGLRPALAGAARAVRRPEPERRVRRPGQLDRHVHGAPGLHLPLRAEADLLEPSTPATSSTTPMPITAACTVREG